MLLNQNQTILNCIHAFLNVKESYPSEQIAESRLRHSGIKYKISSVEDENGNQITHLYIKEKANHRNDFVKTVIEGKFNNGCVSSDLTARIYTDGFRCKKKRIETYNNDELIKSVLKEGGICKIQYYQNGHKKGARKTEDMLMKFIKRLAIVTAIATAGMAVLVCSKCTSVNKGHHNTSYQRQ